MQLGFGFLNSTVATNASFMRGAFGSAPNVAEFDYYTDGYYVGYGPSPATTTPSFISDSGCDYCPSDLSVYDNELPTNQTVHVTFTYTASNQTAVVVVTTNGVPLGQLPALTLNNANGFADSDDIQVDMFSISSYSSAGDDYDSVLAHGSVANIVITVPPPAQNVTGAFSNGVWQVQFTDHLNWLYTLQRTTNLVSWVDISTATSGNGTNLFLPDNNPPPNNAFYRVRADRP
jgi:hypothetical protein